MSGRGKREARGVKGLAILQVKYRDKKHHFLRVLFSNNYPFSIMRPYFVPEFGNISWGIWIPFVSESC